MSTASRARTIKYIQKIGTVSTSLVSSSGKLWQRYTGSGQGTGMEKWGTITPDFSILKPVLEFVVTGSRVNSDGSQIIQVVKDSKFRVRVGDTDFTFDNITGLPSENAGYYDGAARTEPYFKLVQANGHYAIQFLREIVSYGYGNSVTVRFTSTVEMGAYTDVVQASDTISIAQGSQDEAILTIMAVNGTDFTIDGPGESVDMKPMLFIGSDDRTADYTYRWYLFQNGEWSQKAHSGDPATPFSITDLDIGTYGYVKCEALNAGNVVIASAVQEIQDTHDGYYISPGADPEDETIEEGSATRDHVTYTPVLMDAKLGTAVSPNPKYRFLVTDAAGNVLNPYHCNGSDNIPTTPNGSGGFNSPDDDIYGVFGLATSPIVSYTVTIDQCRQAGGDVSLMMMTDGSEDGPHTTT